MVFGMKIIEKWVLIIGVLLCGTYLSADAFDKALTSRHIIWCVFTMALLVCWLIRRPSIPLGTVPIALLVLLGFECLSGFQAINKSEWLYHVLKTALMVVSIFMFASIDKKYLIRALVVLGAVFFCIAQREFLKTPYVDCKGIFCNRNPWAIAQFMIIPFCLMEKKWKWFARLVAVGLTVNIFLLMTRSVLLGFGVSLIAVAVIDKRTRKYVAVISVAVILAVICLRMDRLIHPESLGQRKEIWKATWMLIERHPLGVGVGNWWLSIYPYIKEVDLADSFVAHIWRHPHNDYLWIWAESGLAGLITFVWLFCSAIKRAKNTFLAAGLIGCMAIMFFTSFIRERAFLTLMLCIMLSMTMPKEGTKIRPSRSFITICLIVLSLFCVDLCYRHKSLKFQANLLKSRDWDYPLVETGHSPFSTLAFEGIPFHWYTGIAKFKKGETAIYDFHEALKYSPHNVHVLNALGAAYGKRGDMELAEKYLTDCLDLCPDFEEAKKNMGIITIFKGANQYVNDR